MTLSHSDITRLSSIPNIKMLLLRVAFKQSNYDPQTFSAGSLPCNKFIFDDITLNEKAGRAYHQVVGHCPKSEFIHSCYLHSLSFPLHIMLLLLPKFPFPLLGLVHVDNQIKQLRPIRKDEKLSVSSCFGSLELHPKGWLFSINVEFYSRGELVWQSTSTNLFRTKHSHTVAPEAKHSIDIFTDPLTTIWQLNASLGRRYAKVSGDYNPIHLSKWSAKLFGFKQHIVHGMWTKSYCISALQNVAPSLFLHAFEVSVSFKQPLYLPTNVNMIVEPNTVDQEQQFKVVGIRGGKELPPVHLIGNIRPI